MSHNLEFGIGYPLDAFERSMPLPLCGGVEIDWNGQPRSQLLSVPEGCGGLPVNDIYRLIADRHDTATKRLFLSQAETPEDLVERQAIIAELSMLELERFKGARRLYSDADRFTAAHADQMKVVVDVERSTRDRTAYATKIELYARHAKKDAKGNYVNDEYPVWFFGQYIESSKAAAHTFVERYGQQLPRLAGALTYKASHLPSATKFQPNSYIAKKGTPKNIYPQLQEQLIIAQKQRIVQAVTDAVVNSFEMNPVKLTGEEIVLKGLSHAKFKRDTQEPNDLAIGNTPVVLTGRNGAGKTHLVEAAALAAISAGSVGAATVARGSVIGKVDGFVAGYRPGGGSFGLSAFGTEASQWGQILDWLDTTPGDRKLVIADEPFSTTDPHEQLELVIALTRYITEQGGKFVFTSHSDMTSMVASGLVQAFQLISSGERKRLLVEGIGDAQSFDVAEENGFSPEVIERARQYYNGAEFELPNVTLAQLEEVPSLKEHFGKTNPGLRWFLNRRPLDDPNNPDKRSRFELYREERVRSPETQCNFVLGDENFVDLRWNTGRWWLRHDTNPLSEMLQNLSTINESDIALRREFFENLGSYDHIEELESLLGYFQDITFGLSADCFRVGDSEKQDFYTGANPSIDPGLSVLLVLKDLIRAEFKDEHGFNNRQVSEDQYLGRLQVLKDATLAISEFFGSELDQFSKETIKEFATLVDHFLEILNSSPKTISKDNWGYEQTVIDIDVDFRDKMYAFCDKVTRQVDTNEDKDDDYDSEMYAALRKHFNLRTKNAPYNLREIWQELNGLYLDYEGGEYNHKTYKWSPKIYSVPNKVSYTDFTHTMSSLLGRPGDYNRSGLLSSVTELLSTCLNGNNGVGRLLDQDQKNAITKLASLIDGARKDLGVDARSGYLLKTLQFLSADDNLLGNIAAHFRAVGGEVAEGLADYVEKTFRAYFFGKTTGSEYFAEVQRRVGKKIPIVTTEIVARREREREENRRKGYEERPVTPPSRSDIYKSIMYNEKYRDSYRGHDPYKAAGSLFLVGLEVLGSGNTTPITLYSDTDMLLQIIGTAKTMKENSYSRPIASERLSAHAIKPPLASKELITTPFSYDGMSGIDIISGSNMSGKTFFGRNLFSNLAFGRATGLVSSDGFMTPRYDKVVYIDRPKQDAGKGLSSAMADFKNWQKAFELLETAAPSFVFIDEPFSSVPANYQKALLLASLERLASKGHRVVVATHNHEAMEVLRRASNSSKVPITFHNLHSVATDDGVDFTRQFTEGIAPSMAKEVAKLIGGASLARIFT